MINYNACMATTFSKLGRDAANTMGSKSHYVAVKTLSGLLADSVNTLSFSPNGASLAAGGDDKLVVLLKVPSGKEYARYAMDSSINVLLWGSFAGKEEVLCGTRSGQIFSFDPSKKVCTDARSAESSSIFIPERASLDLYPRRSHTGYRRARRKRRKFDCCWAWKICNHLPSTEAL